jgi:hypothetical protein
VLWLILGAALALSALRAPQLLVEPRFWAEEGSVYYANAQQTRSLEAFVHVPRHTAAYVALSVSVPATLAARLLPVEAAPYATTYAALAILSVVFALVVFGRSLLWNDPVRKALACAVVLLAPSSLGEVWLNSTNSQIYCGLISLCILCEDLRLASPRRIAVYVLLLLFCGLSGVYTAFLCPAFFWKLWYERSRGALAVASTAALATAVQVVVFASLWSEHAIHPSKLQAFDWVRSATVTFYSHFVVPLGLRPLVRVLGEPTEVVAALARGSRDPWMLGVALLGVAGALAILVALVDRDLRSARNGLVIALASLAASTTVFAHFGRAMGRYAVLSGIALLWLLLSQTRRRAGAGPVRTAAAAALLGWALAVGALGYRHDEAFACPAGCPSWRAEVARWRQDPSYAPRIWPGVVAAGRPPWRVKLSPP